MKRLLVLLLMVLSLPILGNAQKINWMTFEEAVKLNETAPKKIFIDVYTDWCGWCRKMDQTTFKDPEVIAYMNENYYAVKFNAECHDVIMFEGNRYINEDRADGRNGIHQLAAYLLQGKMSYPSYVFMNEHNQIITVAPGYKESNRFLPILKYFATDAYKTQTFGEFTK